MRGSRNFCPGGGGGGGVQDSLAKTTIFLVLSLIYWSEMVHFKGIYHFQGSRGGPTFSRVGGCPTFSRGGPIAYLL